MKNPTKIHVKKVDLNHFKAQDMKIDPFWAVLLETPKIKKICKR